MPTRRAAKPAKPAKKLARARPSATAASVASARASLAAHYAARHRATSKAIEAAVRSAWKRLRRETKAEAVYALALYTSGQDSFSYVRISACTEEGLTEVARSYLAREPGSSLEHERAALRWNACDWSHHVFADVRGLAIHRDLAIRSRYEDAAIWDAFAIALERCDAAGVFGEGAERERLTLAILCGDMSSRFFAKGIRRLNSPKVAARALREWRAGLT